MNLIELSRKTIEFALDGKKFEPDEDTKDKFREKKASFVTLTKKGELRGCIGSLIAYRELWKDVQENSLHAAFNDSRFLVLRKEELNKIKIEVSVLSKPEKLEFKDENDLLKKINYKMGIILKNKGYSATFLPQVWEQIPDKRAFLEHLSLKAGLNKDAWRNSDILFYTTENDIEMSS
ncbi:MAG: AmmeMemoRadiSam system protein A [archaeon]|nr:AmmeMemoRadiSam system protein A [archaeon]